MLEAVELVGSDPSGEDFPEGWVATTMGEIAEIVGGGTPKSTDPSNFAGVGHPWITPADLSDFREMYIDRGRRDLSDRGLQTCSATIMPAGAVLMSSRAPIGYLAIASGPISTNQGFKSFVCRAGIVPEFVYFWLKSIGQTLEEMGSGSTFAEISGRRAKEIPLLLAPTAEQRRIVAKVEALLARVNAARGRLAKVPAILKRFRQSVLAAACSGRLTEDWRRHDRTAHGAAALLSFIAAERARLGRRSKPADDEGIEIPAVELPETWAWCRLRDIAEICLGGTPSRKVPAHWNGEIPWVSSGEVANCRISATAERITQEGLENSNAKLYPKGTVLIAMIGEGKTRGQAALLDIEACTNQNAAGLVFDVDSVNSEYVWYWALAEYEKNRDVGRGGNQPALNGGKVRALPIPLPPLAEQEEIARRLRQLLAFADTIERRIVAATSRADKLTQAILAIAFRGELVPTEAELARVEGRAYEPASELPAMAREQSGGLSQSR